MKILMVGTGYVGLVTGACFAEMGHNVICLDIDKEKIKKLNKGIIPIYEPGLEEIVERNKKSKRLLFTTKYEKAVSHADVCFFALPTPSNDDGSCNTSYLESAAIIVAKHMKKHLVLVNKSTVAPGTAFLVREIIQKELTANNSKLTFDVVSNPEFLKEGNAIPDCMKPNRIIIGTNSKKASDTMKEIYAPFMINHDRLIEMDLLSAEMTKYAANAMLATRISFMNELSQICTRIGANINQVRLGIGSDKRIGDSFLYAGIGYGGSCFPKDIRALCHLAKKVDYIPDLLEAVESINNRQKKELAKNIERYFKLKGGLKGKTIAVWGLSFKPDTDDMRDAPSLTLIKQLQNQGAKLRLYDPVAMNNAKKILKDLKNITWCKDEFDATKHADGIALLTEWKQFRLVNFDPVKNNMNNPAFFDGRNQYKSKEMIKKGFDYIGIGVPDCVKN